MHRMQFALHSRGAVFAFAVRRYLDTISRFASEKAGPGQSATKEIFAPILAKRFLSALRIRPRADF